MRGPPPAAAVAQVQRSDRGMSAGTRGRVLQVQQSGAGPEETVRDVRRGRGRRGGWTSQSLQADELGRGADGRVQQPGEEPKTVVRGQLPGRGGRGPGRGPGRPGRGQRLRVPGRRVHAQPAEHIQRWVGRVQEDRRRPGLVVRGGQRRERLRGGAAAVPLPGRRRRKATAQTRQRQRQQPLGRQKHFGPSYRCVVTIITRSLRKSVFFSPTRGLRVCSYNRTVQPCRRAPSV